MKWDCPMPAEIIKFLNSQNLTKSQMAREAGLPRQTLVDFMDGKNANFSNYYKILQYCKKLEGEQ